MSNTRHHISMAGYTKLFNSILASTIWREDDKVRIVWITLLAMADKDGVAEGSIPGLADMARVSIEDAEKALVTLSAPDKYSRSTEHDGRRIEAVEGGWRILNHAKYRHKMSADERREYNRKKQAEWRARNQPVKQCQSPSITVIEGQSQLSVSAHTEAEAEAEAPPINISSVVAKATDDWRESFEEFWNFYPKKVEKKDVEKKWSRLPATKREAAFEGLKRLLPTWSTDQKYVMNPLTYLNGERWNDEPILPAKSNGNHQPNPRVVGTRNEGTSAQYAGIGRFKPGPGANQAGVGG